MHPNVYHVLHVTSLLLLTALTFQAFANPDPARRKATMKWSGILSLVIVVAGFGLITKLNYEFASGWIWIKLVCWLGLSALSGVAFRKPETAGKLWLPATILLLVAVYAVYYKPMNVV